MIFSNKIYKLSKGKNVSLFSESENVMTMFLFNENLCRRKIVFDKILRCIKVNTTLEGEFAKKIAGSQICVSQNKFMVIQNENE